MSDSEPMVSACFRRQHPEAYGRPEVPAPNARERFEEPAGSAARPAVVRPTPAAACPHCDRVHDTSLAEEV